MAKIGPNTNTTLKKVTQKNKFGKPPKKVKLAIQKKESLAIEKMSEQLGPGQVFQWRDDMHWQLPKAEMRTRVDQWNAALAEVAREKQLSQDVVQRNAASMAAPCANPICTVLSKKVKSCGKCGRVAYCSRDCQIQHWKEGGHKAQCISR